MWSLYIEILTQRVGTEISKHLNFRDLKAGIDYHWRSCRLLQISAIDIVLNGHLGLSQSPFLLYMIYPEILTQRVGLNFLICNRRFSKMLGIMQSENLNVHDLLVRIWECHLRPCPGNGGLTPGWLAYVPMLSWSHPYPSAMMSYVLKGGLLAYSYISSLKLFTMTTSTNPFVSLLTPTLRNHIGKLHCKVLTYIRKTEISFVLFSFLLLP